MSMKPATMRRLMREIKELQTSPPEGIRVAASEDNMLDITGIIQGPEGTPYAGGYFRVKFTFTEEFPAAPPKCRMVTKIFHPNVSAAGEICVNTLKKDWQSTYGIAHILVTVKCLLIYPNPESALDQEAGRLLLEDYEDYCEHARIITSVHSTPRVPPPEFATSAAPSSSISASASASTPAPTNPTTLPTSRPMPLSSSVSSTTLTVPASTATTAATPAKPISTNSENTSTAAAGSTPEKGAPATGKENENAARHPSPAPLGPADNNKGGVTTGAKEGMSVPSKTASATAVKRTAGGANGARKKALKRL